MGGIEFFCDRVVKSSNRSSNGNFTDISHLISPLGSKRRQPPARRGEFVLPALAPTGAPPTGFVRQFLGVRGLKCVRKVRSRPRARSALIDLGAAWDFRSAHIEAGLCTPSTVLRVHNLLDTGGDTFTCGAMSRTLWPSTSGG